MFKKAFLRLLFTLVILGNLWTAGRVGSAGPCTLQIVNVQTDSFPQIEITIRAVDAGGLAVRDLLNSFHIEESTDYDSADIRPDVRREDGLGGRVAISLILDTRNNTTREELNQARDFARTVVSKVNERALIGHTDADLMALWLPGESEAVRVPFEQGDYQTLVNGIKRDPVPPARTMPFRFMRKFLWLL